MLCRRCLQETFLSSHLGRCYWHLVSRHQDVAKYSKCIWYSPTTKKYPVQNVSTTKAEKPCYRETLPHKICARIFITSLLVMGKTKNNLDATSRRMDKYNVVYTNDRLTAILKSESNIMDSFQKQTVEIHIAWFHLNK